MKCDIPPKGWKCTLEKGHDGPCAAVPVPWWKQVLQSIGEAVGQSKFGG